MQFRGVYLILYELKFDQNYLNLISIGIASHLILDIFNKTGVPIACILFKKNIHLAEIKTGSAGDTTVRWLIITYIAYRCLMR